MGNPRKTFSHVCRFCNKDYTNHDVKGNICFSCKSLIECSICHRNTARGYSLYRQDRPGICSRCWQTTNKGKRFTELTKNIDYVSPNKGKTYLEIHGTEDTRCGYQKGDKNIAKDPNIRIKISSGVTKSYTFELRKKRSVQGRLNMMNPTAFGKLKYINRVGECFRSTPEKDFSELMLDHNLLYMYEGKHNRYTLSDGSVKVVDFIIGNVVIEITGFAYDKWQNSFVDKIKKLRLVISDRILVITYKDKLSLLRKMLGENSGIDSLSFDDSLEIINYIKEKNVSYTENI